MKNKIKNITEFGNKMDVIWTHFKNNCYYIGTNFTGLENDELFDFILKIKSNIYQLNILRNGIFSAIVYIDDAQKYILPFSYKKEIFIIEFEYKYGIYEIDIDNFHQYLILFINKLNIEYKCYHLFYQSSSGNSYDEFNYGILPKNILEKWFNEIDEKLFITVDNFYLELGRYLTIDSISNNIISIELYLNKSITIDEVLCEIFFIKELNNILQKENIIVDMLYPEKAVAIIEYNYNQIFKKKSSDTYNIILKIEEDGRIITRDSCCNSEKYDDNSFYSEFSPLNDKPNWNVEIRCFLLYIEANLHLQNNSKFIIYDLKEHKLTISNLLSNSLLLLGILKNHSNAIEYLKVNGDNGLENISLNIFADNLEQLLRNSLKKTWEDTL
jgi:hypothetical protein